MKFRSRNIVLDKDDKPVYLAESPWVLNANIRDHGKVEFHSTSEFKTGQSISRAAG
jgi:peptide chain release factor 3